MTDAPTPPTPEYDRYIGIDVGSRKSVVVEKAAGLPAGAAFSIAQSDDGLADLVARLGAHRAPPDRTLVALESTGTYSAKLVSALRAAGYKVALLNPRHARMSDVK